MGNKLPTIIRSALVALLLGAVILSATYCRNTSKPKDTFMQTLDTARHYLNINDTVKYVGMHTCMLCHQGIHDSFMHTGMGKSFDIATKEKSSAKFGPHVVVYDKAKDFYYHPFWKKDSLYILEYRMQGRDTIYRREQQINYIIGSGQHTNSHIYGVNGYLFQAPITFYTQEGKWDLAPGFSDGFNSRFTREVGLECMNCHNSYPDFVQGSTNKFTSVPSGIACERCHGPGQVHVMAIQMGHRVDTTKAIDYTIVNPAKLPVELQVDVCQRCHLQGNSVLKQGKSYFDFRPGMHLSDIEDVFMPKYEGMEEEYIMASHIARLKMSKCYMNSLDAGKNSTSLKPYQSSMTCVTCHDPHVDVRSVGDVKFNNVCMNCHAMNTKDSCTDLKHNSWIRKKMLMWSDASGKNFDYECVSCHMPKGKTIDIPHVITTDHYIRIPVKESEKVKLKKFITLYDVNNSNPSAETKGKAFIQQFARFQSDFPALLDSAKHYFSDATPELVKNNFSELVDISFYKEDYHRILDYVNAVQAKNVLDNILTHKDYDNTDAWTAYRIGEAFYQNADPQSANAFYVKATQLAPYVLEFRNKLGATQVLLKQIDDADRTYDFILTQDPQFISALTNKGYIALLKGDEVKAKSYYDKALALDPDDKQAMLNTAGWYIYKKDYKGAEKYLEMVLKKYPTEVQAKQTLEKLKNLNHS
jgi:Flp pilus assembly protein TadD